MEEARTGAGRRVAAVGIPALALVGLVLWLTRPTPPEEPPAAAPAEVAALPDAQPAAVPDDPAASATAAAPALSDSPATGAPPDAPAFDVVRVEPSGSAVVAGTAAPGAEVTVYADAKPLAKATADADGNFVAIFEAPATAAPQALTLGADGEGDAPDVTSGEVVLLLPAAPAGPDAAPGAAAAPEVAATAILRDDGVEVAPTSAGPPADRDVSLASISYAEAGDVMLAGIGTAGSVIRAYVDDRLAREATVGPDGRWVMDLADVAGGIYRLRIDQLAADGRVESRVETPFQRDYPRPPLPRPGGGPGPTDAPGVVTVQPGTNLWTLARLHYGSGMLYTQIFTANRNLIGDPNLIYPGQIFDLPEIDGSE